MLRWIVSYSLRSTVLVLILGVLLILGGLTRLEEMPREVLPEVSPPIVEVQTEALGLSAAEVEQIVTVPIEKDLLSGVAWIDEVRSESIPGLSRIEMIFEPGTDILKARQLVQERLNLTYALPNISKPPLMLQPRATQNRVMMVRLSSDTVSGIDMSVLARWKIKPRLLSVPGVSNIAIWGQRERQLQVQVNPEQLRNNGVTLNQVIRSTGNALWVSPLSFLEASTPGTGGWIDMPNQRLGVQHVLPIKTAAELAQVRLEETPDRILRLGDVANVVEGHQPLIGDTGSAPKPSLILMIEKFPDANTLDVTHSVEEALKSMQPGLPGINADTTVFRPASYIEKSIENIALALAVSLLLTILVLYLILGWRVALLSGLSLLLSLSAAILIISLFNASLNLMVLAGLVLSLAVLITNAIASTQTNGQEVADKHRDTNQIMEYALRSGRPIAYGTLIILLLLLPAFFLSGVSNDLGTFMPVAVLPYLLAVLASMAVAVTITPVLSLILPGSFQPKRPPVFERIRNGYANALNGVIRRPQMAYAAVGIAVLFSIGLLVASSPKNTSVPAFQDSTLLVNWNTAPGTSLPEMNRIATRAADELRSLPGVREVGTQVGRAIVSDQAVGSNASSLWVSLIPGANYQQTLGFIKETVNGYPGLDRAVMSYPSSRTEQLISGDGKDLTVRIFGENMDILKAKAAEVKQMLSRIGGVKNTKTDLPTQEPTLEVKVDLARAQAHGIKPGDVRRASATLISGIEVGTLFEEQKVFEVVVWGTSGTRDNLGRLRDLLIDTPSGSHVRLGDVADVRIVPGFNVIRHQSVSRYVDVTADVQGRGVGAVAADIKNNLWQIKFPLEYHAEVLNDYAQRGADQNRLISIIIGSIIGILLLLQSALGGWRLALAVLIALPLALTGGLVAGILSGELVSIGGLLGLLTALAVAVLMSLSLLSRYQYLENARTGSDIDLVQQGSRDQSTLLAATTLAIAVLFASLWAFGQRPGHEVLHSASIVMLGGMITTALLILFIIPLLYLRFKPGVSLADLTGQRDKANSKEKKQ